MSMRPRTILPAVTGAASLPLVFWDISNARVIESMGMAWDTGAPIWPYEASDIFLRLLNAPAYSIAMPLANWLRLAEPTHLFVVVPAILIWWWFLGFTLDRGLGRWPLLGMVVVLVALLLWSATVIPGVFRLRLNDQALLSATLLIVHFLTPVVWLIALTSLLFLRTKGVAGQLA